jgi:hypothetical protein
MASDKIFIHERDLASPFQYQYTSATFRIKEMVGWQFFRQICQQNFPSYDFDEHFFFHF